MLECLTCHGTYEKTNPDGTEYYHACPPLAVHEIKAAIAAGTLQLTPAQQAIVDRAKALDLTAPPAAGTITNEDRALGFLVIERPNKRDENIRPGARADDTDKTKAAGAGIKTVPPPAK